jgi:DNA mismatch repair protein MutL
VDYESGAFKVSGYAALPSITEEPLGQTVSVNGRWVRAEGLTKGMDDAYRGPCPLAATRRWRSAWRSTRAR